MLFMIGLWTFLRALLFGRRPSPSRTWHCVINSPFFDGPFARPRLSRWDRIFWVWLSRLWAGWRTTLVIVRPATVLAWHRQGFRLYWRWRSSANRGGRPQLDTEIRRLIRRMARENGNLKPAAHPGGARPTRPPDRRAHRRQGAHRAASCSGEPYGQVFAARLHWASGSASQCDAIWQAILRT